MKAEKKVFNIKVIVPIITTLLLVVFLGNFFHYLNTRIPNSEAIFLDEHWNVRINEQYFEDVDLSKFSFAPVGIKDVFEISTVLPDLKTNRPILNIRVFQSAFNVYLDDEIIYSFGDINNAKLEIVGSGFHFINIPDEYINKTLRIEAHPQINEAFGKIGKIIVQESSNAYFDYIGRNILVVVSGCFLVTIGALLSVVSSFMLFSDKNFLQPLYIGLFSFLIGLWSLGNYNIFQVITNDFKFASYVEFGGLYLAPIPILLLVYEIKKEIPLTKKVLGTMLAINTLFLLFIGIKDLMGLSFIQDYLSIFHLLLVFNVLVVFGCCFYKFRKQNSSEKVLAMGIIILGIFIISDSLRFTLQKYSSILAFSRFTSFAVFGVVVFIAFLVLSYLISIYRLLYKKAEAELLFKLAYTDYLTDIANRTKCESVISECAKNRLDYTIISFDLNDLKKVNDTLGHAIGDEYIKNFAFILNESFKHRGIVGRMGGDEFIVIIKDVINDEVEMILNEMYTKVSMLNKNINEYQLSYAYGSASSKEFSDNDSLTVFVTADKRMYDMKEHMKKAMHENLPINN